MLAATTEEDWAALCDVIGRPELARSGRFADRARRHQHRAELDAIIAAWTRELPEQELAARLQAAGVPAAPVANGADLWSDPVLRSTGFIQKLVHPEAGRHPYPTLGYRLGRIPGAVLRAALCFGEHNPSVLGDLLGMSTEEIEGLVRSGAIAERPLAADASATRRPTTSRGPTTRTRREDDHDHR